MLRQRMRLSYSEYGTLKFSTPRGIPAALYVGIQTGRPLHAGLRPGCTILSNYFTLRSDTNKGDRDTGIESPP
jgi:hypothetical protein